MSILCISETSDGSGGTAHMSRRVWAFIDRICHMYAHFVHVREQWSLWRVWASTDRICHMYAHFVHVWEQWRHWQDSMHVTSSLCIAWKNMSYIRPFMCMCESSEGSGETACMLMLVRALTDRMCHIHWTEVISSHHKIFAPVQKVKIALTKFKFYKNVQGFVETLQIIPFQNDWSTLHRRCSSKGTLISKSHTFKCDINYSSDTLSIYILISLKMFITAVIFNVKNQKVFWQLNTPFLLYVKKKTATVNNLIKGFLAEPCSLHIHFTLLCTLYYLWHSSVIFRGSLLWIGVTVLFKF